MVYCCNSFNSVFHKVVVAVQRCCIQNKYGFFLPYNEADGPGLQRGDLSNSQTSALLKSAL